MALLMESDYKHILLARAGPYISKLESKQLDLDHLLQVIDSDIDELQPSSRRRLKLAIKRVARNLQHGARISPSWEARVFTVIVAYEYLLSSHIMSGIDQGASRIGIDVSIDVSGLSASDVTRILDSWLTN